MNIGVAQRPKHVLGMGVGAVCVSASAVFLALAATSTGTASAYRCVLALPVVAFAARAEAQRHGRSSRPEIGWAVVAGVLFAIDMLFWTAAIPEVGAGLSTVLVNAQIVLVPLLARVFGGETITRRFLWALPAVLLGVVLTGGVFEHGLSGTDPALGTVQALIAALGYSGFLYLLRRGGTAGRPIQTYLVVLVTAALVCASVGSRWQGITVTPGWAAFGWLCAVTVCGQLLGWFLVALCAPHLSADAGAALLLLTPVGALVLGAVVLGEKPSPWQILGAALMLAAAYLGTRRAGADQRSAEPHEIDCPAGDSEKYPRG